MNAYLWVSLGGAIGACARFSVAQWLAAGQPGSFPWPTFVVNACGALLIGLAIGWFGQSGWFSDYGRAFFVTGVLGGFTTFSAFSLEVVQLAQAGFIAQAVTYALVSLLVCAAFAALGLMLGVALTTSS